MTHEKINNNCALNVHFRVNFHCQIDLLPDVLIHLFLPLNLFTATLKRLINLLKVTVNSKSVSRYKFIEVLHLTESFVNAFDCSLFM